jgi:hypothetical protein
MMRRAVLVNESDVRLGTVDVPSSCSVIRYGGGYFYRTEKTVRLRPAHTAMAVVFDQTEVYVRERLDPA